MIEIAHAKAWLCQLKAVSLVTEACWGHKTESSHVSHQAAAEPAAAPAQVLHLSLHGGQALLLARVQVVQLARLALVLPG